MTGITSKDKILLTSRGITEESVNQQLKMFQNGFPFLRILRPAVRGNGIMAIPDNDVDKYRETWEDYRTQHHRIVKFVPASGAASRMFKDLFAFLKADYQVPQSTYEHTFFDNIHRFAFYDELNKCCVANKGKDIDALMEAQEYKTIVSLLLEPTGMNYGALPKGLLLFHRYADETRTPFEEHLMEGALYASTDGMARIHFTVSGNHLPLFQSLTSKVIDSFAQRYGIRFNISFSEQKKSTDTIAVNTDNTLFRDQNGDLLFRPGGHGALIENLNDLDADIVFIKNIDNVVPDRLKADTVTYKQLLAGVLVTMQQQAFGFLRLMDSGQYTHDDIEKMIRFLRHDLSCNIPDLKNLEDAELISILRKKMNRPMRVCGMVRNVGEPGGGPFCVYDADGSESLQILESSQIDTNDADAKYMFEHGTHFNPVDLVCAVRDYKGKRFNLLKHIDPATGFISHKSKNGRELKALELPGLWNGAMSDWNTVFVEVPLSTFNPVKTVNDLLRQVHQ
ncbi:MAG: DUF4301 family protein [Bacteroidales bacterium]|nr:DUF4301 family protein [Bacteroidales bacterium]